VRVRPIPRLALGVAETHAHACSAHPVRVLRPARRARRQPLNVANRGRATGISARPIVFPRATRVLADADTHGVARSREGMSRAFALVSGFAELGYRKLRVSVDTSALQVPVTKSQLRIFVAAFRPSLQSLQVRR
jgi:hypothetical protein